MKTMAKRIFCFLMIFAMAFGCINLSAPAQKETQAKNTTYWIKVNKKANVVTVYKKSGSKYKAIKAFLCSCGGSNTPSGTYYTPAKYRWHTLMGPSYGQYCTRIHGGVLFHSVWYYSNGNRKSQAVKEFNKLGKTASHGCVRLSVKDSKWIYDNCPVGTKVTIYSSSKSGALGKPAGYKMPSSAGTKNWDPTDASSSNPYYQALPSLSQKVKTIYTGDSDYSTARKLVKASQHNGKSVTVKSTVKKYNSSKKKYVSASYSNSKAGTYKITYKVTSTKGITLTKTFKFTVKYRNSKAPVVSVNDDNNKVVKGTTNAVQWLKSAKMTDGTSVLSAVSVKITPPYGATSTLTYNDAKSFTFSQVGNYKISYTAANKYKTSAKTTKSVDVTVYTNPTISATQGTEITVDNGAALDLSAYVTAKDYDGTAIDADEITYSITKDGTAIDAIDTTQAGTYKVTYTATESCTDTLTASVTITFKVKAAQTTKASLEAVKTAVTE